ncbi:MAG: hypothetical protein ACSHX4_08785 [Opitutaceae bacterium]
MLRIALGLIHWLVLWIYYVAIICFIGAMAGVVTHLLFALLFREHADLGYFASFGFMNGLNYGVVWAGGASIVICVIRARNDYMAKQTAEEGVSE